MKNFNEIYEKLYEESNEELERLRKKKNTGSIIYIIIAIIVLIISIKLIEQSTMILPVFVVGLMCTIVTFKIYKNSRLYRLEFKNKIIGAFIKNVDGGLNYYPEKGAIDPRTYRSAEFENFDLFSSEDSIEGVLDGKYSVKMAEVHTQQESTDSDGNRTTTTVFHGLFGVIDCCKNIKTKIKVRNDAGKLGNLFSGKRKVEMDSTEFEKYFDIYAENKIITMQILTADVMALMIDFREKYKIKYELTIISDKIYIRFHTGDVFEPKAFKSALDYNTLKKYYDIIEFIFNVSREINKTIEKTEI